MMPERRKAEPGPHAARLERRINRDVRLFHVFRLLSTSYLFVPVLVRFFQDRGLDFTHIALLNTVYALTAIVCEVPTGALADRFGRRNAMVLGSLLMAGGCVVDWGGDGFWAFALGEGLLALGMTLTSGADSAYLFDLLRAAGRESEYRRFEGTATAAKLIGAAAALVIGGLLGRHAVGHTYAASAAVCVAAALVAALLRERPVSRTGAELGFWRGVASAGREVAARPVLRFAVGFSVLVFTLLRMGLYVYPPYLEGAGLDLAWTGAVLAALSLAGAVGAQQIERIRRLVGEARLVWGLPLVVGVAYLALGRWVAVWGIGLIAAQSIANGIYSPLSKELLNREITDSGQRATVLSVESMARRLAFGAFAPLAGVLTDRVGQEAALVACAALGLAGAAALFVWTPRRRAGLAFQDAAGAMVMVARLEQERPEAASTVVPCLTAETTRRRLSSS